MQPNPKGIRKGDTLRGPHGALWHVHANDTEGRAVTLQLEGRGFTTKRRVSYAALLNGWRFVGGNGRAIALASPVPRAKDREPLAPTEDGGGLRTAVRDALTSVAHAAFSALLDKVLGSKERRK